MCLSEETLKAGGPFYLVSIPGEVKDPTCVVDCSGLTNSTTHALAQDWAVWRKPPENLSHDYGSGHDLFVQDMINLFSPALGSFTLH